MYLFNRTAKFKGEHAAAGAAFAVEVAAVASKITGHPIAVFQAAFGAPLGTIMWTVRHQSHAELGDAMTKLLSDATYNQMVLDNAHLFEGDIVDSFNNVVSSTLDATVRPYYALVLATAANGKMAEAVAFGVKAQAHVAKATGLPTAFSTNVYGAFGAVSWITGADSMADLDKIAAMQATDAGYHAIIQESGPLFIPGSGLNGLIVKIN